MTDKEHEGIEKEKNTPDTEAPDNGTQTTGAGSGKEVAGDKHEKQNSDVEKSEGQTETTGKDSGEETVGNDSGQRTTDAEESKDDTQINGTGEGNDDSKPEPKKKSSLQDRAQMVTALAALFTAVISLLTMCEMKIERNIAYRPEIVVSPNVFEGGIIGVDEEPLIGNYFYIDFQTDDFYFYYLQEPEEYSECLYLEAPYLTLKNIGQGTAKNIEVTFSMDWVESVAAKLSEIEDVDYSIRKKISRSGTKEISLLRSESGDSEQIFLSIADDLVKKITYIASDEASVNVALPDCWMKMFAILCGRTIRKNTNGGLHNFLNAGIDIPDPVIHLHYSDMQEEPYDDDIVVPWTGSYTYYNSSHSLDSDDEESTQLRTGFYEGYIE